jgi:hypothetical protein
MPVSTETSGLPDASSAADTIDKVTEKVLAKGWHENMDYEYTLSPTVDNEIEIAEDMLRVDTAGKDKVQDVTVRTVNGVRKLWHVKDQTHTFTSALLFDIVWAFPFEGLTHELQEYIAALAARTFQEAEMGSVALDSFTQRQVDDAWSALQDSEAEKDDANELRDNSHAWYVSRRQFRRYR